MPGIDDQITYCDARWAERDYINPFALQRLISILEMLNVTNIKKPRILDLGCGTGWLTGILNEFGPTTGVELSQKTVRAARLKYPAAEFIAGNLFEISLQKKTYDVIVSQEVIEHVEDQKGYVSITAEC
jgi:2-polyprenyl-3-methyl-5-hydroxy-6-metoxy-1,4-benzoquinol methylase